MRAINAGKLRDGGVRELNRQANGREQARVRGVVSSKTVGAASIDGRTSIFSESQCWPRTSVYTERREYKLTVQSNKDRHKLSPLWEGSFIIDQVLRPGTLISSLDTKTVESSRMQET
jgi:hypothetical protein